MSHRQLDAVIALKPVEHDAALLKEISLIRELKLKLCAGTDVALRLMHRDLKPLALMRNQIIIAVVTGTKQHLRIAVRAGHSRIRGPRSSTHIAERNITRHPRIAVRIVRDGIGRILVTGFKRKRSRFDGLACRREQSLLRCSVILEHTNLETILSFRECKIVDELQRILLQRNLTRHTCDRGIRLCNQDLTVRRILLRKR